MKSSTVFPSSPTPRPSHASPGSAASASAPLPAGRTPPPLPKAAESIRSIPGSASSAAATVFGSAWAIGPTNGASCAAPPPGARERLAQEARDVA